MTHATMRWYERSHHDGKTFEAESTGHARGCGCEDATAGLGEEPVNERVRRGLFVVGGVVLVSWALRETVASRLDAADRPVVRQGEVRRPSGADGTPGRRGALGIVSRPVDPATDVGVEHMLDPSRREAYADLVDEAPDLLELLRSGQREWSDLLIDLDTNEDAQEAYETCSRIHLRAPCTYSIGFVVEPLEDGMGRIAYGRALSSRDVDDECRRYASCMAKARVGDEVRIPRGLDRPIAHRRHVTDYRDPSIEDDLEAHRKWLAEIEAGLRTMLEQGPDGSPDWEWRLALERSYVSLLEKKIARLEREQR